MVQGYCVVFFQILPVVKMLIIFLLRQLEAAEKETCNAADGSVSDVGTSLKAKKAKKGQFNRILSNNY